MHSEIDFAMNDSVLECGPLRDLKRQINVTAYC